MELSSFIILISLIPAIASSMKCQDSQWKCIPLCCKVTEYYLVEQRFCRELPESGDLKWHLKWGEENLVKFVEYENCSELIDAMAFIPLCYSPVYTPGNASQIHLKKFKDVPCNRADPKHKRLRRGLNYKAFKNFTKRKRVVGLVTLCAMLVCLPSMIVYTCRQGFRKHLLLQLVTWYFITMTAFTLAVVLPIVWQDDTIMQMHGSLGDLRTFFCAASCLWLNAVGIQIWLEFKVPNSQNTIRQDRMRLLYFSICVWGSSAILTSIQQAASERNMKGVYGADWIMFGISCFNMLTFIILAADICQTRCRVATLTREAHFKRELIRLILRLGLMMGLPRMIMMVASFFLYLDTSLCRYFCLPEPFVVFVGVVWKTNTDCCSCGLICCNPIMPEPTTSTMEFVQIRYEGDEDTCEGVTEKM